MIEILPNWHPIFVHFTVGMFMTAAGVRVATHAIADGTLKDQLLLVARWNLWLGMAATTLTVAAGIYAYNTVDHDTPSHAAMTLHRNWAIVTTLVFVAVTLLESVLRKRGTPQSPVITITLVAAAALLAATSWRGGELVYRHGLGVKSLPQTEGAGHSHDHGEGHTHDDASNSPGAEPEHDAHDHSHSGDEGTQEATPHTHETVSEQPATKEQNHEHTHAPGTPPHKD